MTDTSQPRPHAGNGARRSTQTQTRITPSPLPAALAGGLALLLAAPPQARALALTVQLIAEPTFTPGDVVVFDSLITNVSDQTAIFGTNTWSNGVSWGGPISPYSPYLDGVDAKWFPDQSLEPGQTLRFPFYFFDTKPNFPLNSAISMHGNFLFITSLPPTDYLIVPFTSNDAISVPKSLPAVPGPAGAPLFGLALLSRLRAVRRRQTTGASGPS